jgi:hypothetical protein
VIKDLKEKGHLEPKFELMLRLNLLPWLIQTTFDEIAYEENQMKENFENFFKETQENLIKTHRLSFVKRKEDLIEKEKRKIYEKQVKEFKILLIKKFLDREKSRKGKNIMNWYCCTSILAK